MTEAAPTAGSTFFGALDAAFAAATAAAGLGMTHVRLGGTRFILRFAGDAVSRRLLPALAARRVAADLTGGVGDDVVVIDAFDSASTGVSPPRPPWETDAVGVRGEIRGFDDGATRVAFNVGSEVLSVFDRAERRGVWWTRDAGLIPYYETASPLRTLLTWALEERGATVVHAACVARGGDGVLLTAKGGSGKSTTALLCLDAGFGFLGDNNVATTLDPEPRAHALYGSASLRRDNRVPVRGFAAAVTNPDRADEKALTFPGAAPGERFPASCRLRAILLPRVSGSPRTRLLPASPGAALQALAPSSLFAQPGARAGSFAAMARLVRRLPAFVLDLADDGPAVARTVAEALSRAEEAVVR